MTTSLVRPHQESSLAFAWRRWKLQRRFRRKLGYIGNFENPQTYEEKIQFRKLYGNHEFYAQIADKYLVRDYIAEKAGSRYLVPLLGVYDQLTPQVFDTLPDQFIIKANHGCQWHKIVHDKSTLDIPNTIGYFNRLMKKSYGKNSGEYHYSLIRPKILIEELLLDQGETPCEYSIFCYHNTSGFDFAINIRLADSVKRHNFDSNWNEWDGMFTEEELQRYVNPPNFSQMVEVAKTLSQGFDFVRVDFYNIAGQIYLGELTLTPAGGLYVIPCKFRSEKRSEMWEMGTDNPRLYQNNKAA